MQLALIRSHAAGAGDPLPADAVRALLLLRARHDRRRRVRLPPGAAGAAARAARPRPAADRPGQGLGRRVRRPGPARRGRAAAGRRGPAGRPAGRRRARGRGTEAARARPEGGAHAHQRHRADAGGARARGGRCRGAGPGRRRRVRAVGGGAARHRPRVRRPGHPDPPASRAARQRRQPAPAAREQPAAGQPPALQPRRPGPVLAALRAAGARCLPGRHRVLPAGRGGRARLHRRQPGRRGRDRRRRVRGHVDRQLPRAAAGVRRRHARDGRGRAGQHQRAAGLPAARPGHLPRPAAVPGPQGRDQLRLHARPVHGRVAGRREQGAGPPGRRGQHPDQRQPGGPRLDGLARRPQGRRGARERVDGPRGRAALRGPGDRPAGRYGGCRGRPRRPCTR